MDYLIPGDVIALGKTGRLTLGYLNSCNRETILGGTVTVGARRSTIKHGKITRNRVECDAGGKVADSKLRQKSAVLVLRRPAGPPSSAQQRPTVTIYSTTPIIRLSQDTGHVRLDRIDQSGPSMEFPGSGKFIDLADHGGALQPGGIYALKSGDRSLIFKVDAFAGAEAKSVIERLLRF